MNEYGTYTPVNEEDAGEGSKDGLVPVKEPPIVKKPGKEEKFYEGINMNGRHLPTEACLVVDKYKHFHQHGCTRVIDKGIVSRINDPEPYYPYDESYKDTLTKNELKDVLH